MVVWFLADSRRMSPVLTQSGDFTLTAEKSQKNFLIPHPINTRSWLSSFPILLSPSFHKPYSLFHSHFQLTAIFFLSLNYLPPLSFVLFNNHSPSSCSHFPACHKEWTTQRTENKNGNLNQSPPLLPVPLTGPENYNLDNDSPYETVENICSSASPFSTFCGTDSMERNTWSIFLKERKNVSAEILLHHTCWSILHFIFFLFMLSASRES